MGVYGQVAGKSSRPKLELHRLKLLVTFGDLTKISANKFLVSRNITSGEMTPG